MRNWKLGVTVAALYFEPGIFKLELLLEEVQRQFQMSGSPPAASQHAKGVRNGLRNFLGIVGAAVPFGNRPGECQLIHSVEQTAPPSRHLGMNLTGNEENRNRVAMRDSQSGGGVGYAWPRRNAAYAWLSRRPCVAVCHQGCRLFVTHENMLELRVPIERVVNCHGMCARYSKDHLDAVPNETLDNELTTSHLAHHLRP